MEDPVGFLLFVKEVRASGKARGANDEELFEDWEELAPAKQREYNDRAQRKAANAAAKKPPTATKTEAGGGVGAVHSPRDAARKGSGSSTGTTSNTAPIQPNRGCVSSTSSTLAAVAPLKKFKHVAMAPLPTPTAGQPPKKPRPAFDLYVLKAFSELKAEACAEAPIDLGLMTDERLRTVCRLVFANSRYDADKSRNDLVSEVSQYLAEGGKARLRFKKAAVQADAKTMWKAMSDTEKLPYEEQAAAEKQAFRLAVEQETAAAAAAPSSDKQLKEERSEKPSTSSAANVGSSGDGHNALLHGVKKRKQPATTRTKAAKEQGSVESGEDRPLKGLKKVAAAKAKEKEVGGAKRKHDDKDDKEGGGVKGKEAAPIVEEFHCPELGLGWRCVSKRRVGSGGGGSKHVDKYYVDPDGKQYNSRLKALKAAGLDEDPLTSMATKRPLTAKDRQKQRMVRADARALRLLPSSGAAALRGRSYFPACARKQPWPLSFPLPAHALSLSSPYPRHVLDTSSPRSSTHARGC